MAKYLELAERISERFNPEIMCSILGGASKEKIADLLKEYGIEQ